MICIEDRKRHWVQQHSRCLRERHAMLGDVRLCLGRIPCDIQFRCAHTAIVVMHGLRIERAAV